MRHHWAVTSTPGWATRIARERSARNWSQALAVSNLQAVYERSTGKSAGTSESLIRQWKDWEAGRVRPTFWAPHFAATFGTVEADLFAEPRPEPPAPAPFLAGDSEMYTAELVMRLQASTLDSATLRAVDITIDRLNSDYRLRPGPELRTEAQQWLSRLSSLLDQRLNYAQHRQVLEAAARLALLVGCVEYDSGDPVTAEVTRRFALDLATEIDDKDLIGWAYEMAAWFALTAGDYNRVITTSDTGIEIVGNRSVSVQLAAQAAKAWARLGNLQQAEVASTAAAPSSKPSPCRRTPTTTSPSTPPNGTSTPWTSTASSDKTHSHSYTPRKSYASASPRPASNEPQCATQRPASPSPSSPNAAATTLQPSHTRTRPCSRPENPYQACAWLPPSWCMSSRSTATWMTPKSCTSYRP